MTNTKAMSISRRQVLKISSAAALVSAARLAFPSGAFAATAGPEVTGVKLGYIALTDAAPLIIAQEKGLFAKYGLTEVEVLKQASWGATRDNLVLGGGANGIDGAKRFSEEVFGVLFSVLMILTIGMQLSMPLLVQWIIAPGFAADPEKFNLTVRLAIVKCCQACLPCLLCLAIEAAEALVDVFHIGPGQAVPRILGQPRLPLRLCCCVIACRVQPREPPCRRLQHGR